MKIFSLLAVFTSAILFFAGCNSAGTNEPVASTANPNAESQNLNNFNDNYLAKDNFNLPAVGSILRQSDSASDFERRLNAGNGVNNLDLNGDGYADYISVAEYEDRDTGQRGFSLFDKFGSNAIQEIATIILDRTLNNGRRDTRAYLNGNDQIYGDDNFYQSDWKDTALNIANWAFQDRSSSYSSPYYYDNYPDYYETYRIVETPVYVTRIEQNYSDPVFVKASPTVTQIKIKSPYAGQYYDKIYAGLAKPNESQKEFKKNNPKPPEFVPNRREKIKNIPPGLNKSSKDEIKPEREKGERDNQIESSEITEKSKPDKVKHENNGNGKNKELKMKPNKKPEHNQGKENGKGNGGGNGKGKGGKGKG